MITKVHICKSELLYVNYKTSFNFILTWNEKFWHFKVVHRFLYDVQSLMNKKVIFNIVFNLFWKKKKMFIMTFIRCYNGIGHFRYLISMKKWLLSNEYILNSWIKNEICLQLLRCWGKIVNHVLKQIFDIFLGCC